VLIDETKVRAPLKWEEASDGWGTFPHIYGELNTDAVARVTDYREHDGVFRAPKWATLSCARP
jgi:uncharacterized protein (DUF952 family)